MGGLPHLGVRVLNAIAVLGATGSIGTQALEVAKRLEIEVTSIGARRGSEELLALGLEWPEADVVVAAPTADERDRFAAAMGSRVRFGADELAAAAAAKGLTVVNGIVGAAGLVPTVAALEAGNRLALANKESVVAGGDVVKEAARRGGGELVAVDSEHYALSQCLQGEDPAGVKRFILTASGGPFRGKSAEDLEAVTPAQALAHPVWEMGRRISIDSATLMNKAFEVIEAHHLFDAGYDDIDVLVHPEGLVHGMVEFVDGSTKASLGEPDMRIPLQWAITRPDRLPAPEAFDPAGRSLTFQRPDREAFPSLDLGYAAGRAGGSAPAVLNAADEVAVEAFLQGQIGFSSIPVVVERTLQRAPGGQVATVGEVLEADAEARGVAREIVGTC